MFNTVEVNNTFYRLPERATFAAWRDGMPEGFVAAIKASRFLTHMKKLLHPEEPIARLFERAAALVPRLGPVLYQLPATLRMDLPRLEQFLGALPMALAGEGPGAPPPRLQHAIEFRHPSWYNPAVYDRLDAAGVALCLHDRTGSAIGGVAVGPFIYVRYHGSTGAYSGSYSHSELEHQAGWLSAHYSAGRDVYAYFNNDIGGAAPANAQALSAAMRRRVGIRA